MQWISDRPAELAASCPRRFRALVEWNSRTERWFASVPVLGPLSVCAASRGEAIEFVKTIIRSYVDRSATDGPRIPPESYEEVLEVEVEVPLKGVLT